MFKPTEGWLQKFMLWHGLSLRRKTTTAQQDTHCLIDKFLPYILQLWRLPQQHKYQPCCIIAMDKTLVWNDMVSNTNADKVGASFINLKTTGQEKLMVTLCLSAQADGTELKSFIVFCAAKCKTKTK